MILKLTYYNSKKPILVNMEKVLYITKAYDTRLNRFSSKIVFKGKTKDKSDQFINVDEDLKTIHDLINSISRGNRQLINWDEISFEDAISKDYTLNI